MTMSFILVRYRLVPGIKEVRDGKKVKGRV